MWLMKILTLQFPNREKNKKKMNIVWLLSSVRVRGMCVCVTCFLSVLIKTLGKMCSSFAAEREERSRMRPWRQRDQALRTEAVMTYPSVGGREAGAARGVCLPMHRERWRCWVCENVWLSLYVSIRKRERIEIVSTSYLYVSILRAV